MKSQSVFFNDEIVALIQRCDEQCEAKKARQVEIIEAAKWWKEKSYDELWNLMFSSTIKRSRW
ncbi:MAG: hypothetical protein HPY74_16625 [Firmicutes bacterium]|nr:hypothetical protein [Bacillota bacterium]